jgi:hypothetical protein
MPTRLLFLIFASILLPVPLPAQEQFDPCSLLTKAEIAEVQGDPVVDTTSSAPARQRFAVSQCFYTAKTFAKSVSLEVTRRSPKETPPRRPRDEWSRLFHPSAAGQEKPAKVAPESKKKRDMQPPQPVKGIGDEAFWVGDQFVGTLYVLKDDAYFRISVGGWSEGSQRLEKSKALAQKVVRRL